MKRILIIQTAFIGDVILATPLIESLHARFPESQIDFLLRKGNEVLFYKHPILKHIIIWDKVKFKYVNLVRVLFKVRFKQYDLVVNIQRFFSTGLITCFSNARITIGFDKNPFSFFFTHRIKYQAINTHEVERNLALISKWVYSNKRHRPVLYPRLIKEWIIKIKDEKPYVCIAPASVWFTKQWPAEKWIEFIIRVKEGLKIYLLGAETERDCCETIKNGTTRNGIYNLAGQLSLLESAELMKGAAMNFVNDSAPLHLASSVNAPVTAIYCSTIPEFGFTPLSDYSFILQTSHALSCRPCGMHGKKACPEGHFKCADIDIERLLHTLG